MKPHSIPRPGTNIPPAANLRHYHSTNLFRSLIPAKIAQVSPDPFVTALAHEVRNPLTTINLAVEMLRSAVRDEDRAIYLEMIMRGSGRINDLVTDLLVSSPDDGLRPGRHSVHQLLDEVLSMNQDRIMLKKIRVMKEYTTLDCKILANKQRIKIALTNIVINAIDAMPSENGMLRLVTRSINDQCIVVIEDNGIGISKENLENIFTPYFTDKPGGMGLGLSTTLDILHANHADVNVLSERGSGTRFILSFDRTQHD